MQVRRGIEVEGSIEDIDVGYRQKRIEKERIEKDRIGQVYSVYIQIQRSIERQVQDIEERRGQKRIGRGISLSSIRYRYNVQVQVQVQVQVEDRFRIGGDERGIEQVSVQVSYKVQVWIDRRKKLTDIYRIGQDRIGEFRLVEEDRRCKLDRQVRIGSDRLGQVRLGQDRRAEVGSPIFQIGLTASPVSKTLAEARH